MRKRIDKQLLRKVQREYLASTLTIRQLAEKHGLNALTLRNHATRGKWLKKAKQAEQEKFQSMLETKLESRAEQTANKAAAFIERSFQEGIEWLDTIRALQKQLQSGDFDGAKKLVDSWARVVDVGRTTLGLDEQPEVKATGLVSIVVNTGCPSQFKVLEQMVEVTDDEETLPDAPNSGLLPDRLRSI